MRKVKETSDKSTPYRNLGTTMVKAPVKPSGNPKGYTVKAKDDLRVKGGK